jgi:hypothetical protein
MPHVDVQPTRQNMGILQLSSVSVRLEGGTNYRVRRTAGRLTARRGSAGELAAVSLVRSADDLLRRSQTQHQEDQEEHEEEPSQELRNGEGAASDIRETECGSQKSDDEKDECLVQHVTPPPGVDARMVPGKLSALSSQLSVTCRQ